MAVTSLGNNTIDLVPGWISFNPIKLQSNREYLLEAQFNSTAPDLIYSTFIFRFRYPNQQQIVVASSEIGYLEYDSGLQALILKVNGLLDNRADLIMQCRRAPYYSQPSKLATVDLELFIDPDNSQRL